MNSSKVITPDLQGETQRMLRSLKDLEGYRISARDGLIGKIHDFFFDDEFWTVRYVVVDTGHWLPGRKVLLTPGVLLNADWQERSFSVALSREQVKNSPEIDTDKPVSRQREIELHAHYGWPVYWATDGGWPAAMIPPMPLPEKPLPVERTGDPHLRSLREITGYDIEASDGNIGHVDDFIAEEESLEIRYLVVAMRRWLPGRKVLIAPQWLVGPIHWSTRTVKIILSCDQIRNSPEFEPTAPVNRDYENQLYDFYGRPKYWD